MVLFFFRSVTPSAISLIAVFHLTQRNTSSCPFPDLQCSPLVTVSSLVQKNPRGLQPVPSFFPRARLDLQFLTICVHIGYICKKIQCNRHWLTCWCRIFLRDCSSFIKQPHDQNKQPHWHFYLLESKWMQSL